MIEPRTRGGPALYWQVSHQLLKQRPYDVSRFATFEKASTGAITLNDGVDDFVIALDDPSRVQNRAGIWISAVTDHEDVARLLHEIPSHHTHEIHRVLREAWHLPSKTNDSFIIQALRIPSEFRRAVFLATLKTQYA